MYFFLPVYSAKGFSGEFLELQVAANGSFPEILLQPSISEPFMRRCFQGQFEMAIA